MGADWIEHTLDWIHTQTKRKRSGSWSETRQKGAGSGSPQQGARGGIRGQSEGGVLGMSGGSEQEKDTAGGEVAAMGEVGRTRRGSRARWGGCGEIPEVSFEVSEGVRAWLMPVRFASTGTSEQEEREEHLHFVSAEALGREHGRRSGRPPSQL